MREKQIRGSGCDEEFGGYGSGDWRSKIVCACVQEKLVDVGAKYEGNYTFRQKVEKRFLVRVRCFQVKEFEKKA